MTIAQGTRHVTAGVFTRGVGELVASAPIAPTQMGRPVNQAIVRCNEADALFGNTAVATMEVGGAKQVYPALALRR